MKKHENLKSLLRENYRGQALELYTDFTAITIRHTKTRNGKFQWL